MQELMTVPNLNYKRCYVDWGGRCAYCNIGLPRIKWDGKIRAGIDHFIPLSKGGHTDPRETNQWPHIERRLAEIAATPLISHRRLKEILPELVKQVYV